jgi:hypothetical protein
MEARSLALLLARVVRLASKETVSPFKKGYIYMKRLILSLEKATALVVLAIL